MSSFGYADLGWVSIAESPLWPCRRADDIEADVSLKRQERSGMVLVLFFGAQAFAWISMKSVQLWNADVDVPDEKRPLLQRIALKEAYEWQKEVFTKPPTRRRNPEPTKPKYEPSQAEQVRSEKKAFHSALKAMYKAQVRELKLAKRRQKAAARGEPLPEDVSMSGDDSDPSGGEDEASESIDDGKPVSHSNTQKTGRWARRNGRPVHHTPSVSSPINNESENDDGDVDEKNDEDRDDGYPDGASSTAPDSGAIDELTEIDLTSAIQRGKFILRARRNETPPPKKRKYTRRTAASPSGGTQPSFTSPTHSSRSADVNSTNDEGGSGEEESDRTGKKRLNRSNRALTRSSQRIPRESTSPVVSKEPDLVFSKNTVSSEQDELEALKLTNTIAARRKLRRSGLHSVQDDELLSLPLPTRTRTKSTPKDSFHIETVSASPESMIAPSAEPSASVTPFSGNTTGHTVQPKKTGRGKYIRKGKRESPAPDPPCDALCASCALARPNSTRHSLGWFMFYMLEDLSTSLRLQQPQYNCSFSGCHTAFYTELELKAHIQTHYSRVEQLYALPPMKKRKEEEVDEEADGPEPSDFAPPNPAQMELSRGSHPQQNGIHMDEDSSQQANSSAPQWAMDVASASKAEPKEVTFYECTYPDCNDGEGEPNWFDSENALQVHVEKAHCGGLGHRLCTRCGLKPVYYGAAPVQPVRAGRYTKHSASPATNCVFGRGRKLPFEPLQGLSDPNMIPLPMMNLSYHPPTPAAIPSPPPIAIPLAAMSAAMHISPPHSTNNGFGTVHNPSHHLQDENDDNRGDDDTDRPKRSTRIRRSSAAASQASSYISSPYGTTAKHMRAAATASSIAPAPAPTEPAPVRVAKHTSVPTTAANPPRKVSKKVAPSAPTNKTTQMPPPSSLPSTTRNQPPRATHPETEPIAPSDMNAFLDLINLCSSIVEH